MLPIKSLHAKSPAPEGTGLTAILLSCTWTPIEARHSLRLPLPTAQQAGRKLQASRLLPPISVRISLAPAQRPSASPANRAHPRRRDGHQTPGGCSPLPPGPAGIDRILWVLAGWRRRCRVCDLGYLRLDLLLFTELGLQESLQPLLDRPQRGFQDVHTPGRDVGHEILLRLGHS